MELWLCAQVGLKYHQADDASTLIQTLQDAQMLKL